MLEPISCFENELFVGKTVVVSGGTSGIGLAIARGFHVLGAKVIVLGSNEGKVGKLNEECTSKRFEAWQLDVRSSSAIGNFCSVQRDVDFLINAAGIVSGDAEWEDEGFEKVVDINLFGQMRLSYGLMKLLKRSKGAIVNVGSVLSYLGGANAPAYTASKTAVLGFTRALAHKLGPDGVRVNAIAPGYHITDMSAALRSSSYSYDAVVRRTALKRWGKADDLVGATVFLCSPAASYITGICLQIDGGYLSGNPLRED